MFKTRLVTFGNDFGHFWNLANFLKTFRRLDPPWNTGQKNFKKITPKHVQNTFGQMGNDFGRFFEVWKFFKNISKTRPSLEHWAKNFFIKITPKRVQNTFGQIGNDFGRFFNFENFLKTFRRLDPPWNTRQKNFLKSTPKHVQNTFGQFGNDFGRFFEVWKFFKNISKTRPSMEHWARKIFSKKLPQNMFKTRLDTFRNNFDHFWNFAKFLSFWNHFEDSTLHGTLRKKNSRKKYPKRVQNTFGQFGIDFGRCLKFENFLKTFRRLDPPWNTGQRTFS